MNNANNTRMFSELTAAIHLTATHNGYGDRRVHLNLVYGAYWVAKQGWINRFEHEEAKRLGISVDEVRHGPRPFLAA